jgi:hypothetical protein
MHGRGGRHGGCEQEQARVQGAVVGIVAACGVGSGKRKQATGDLIREKAI